MASLSHQDQKFPIESRVSCAVTISLGAEQVIYKDYRHSTFGTNFITKGLCLGALDDLLFLSSLASDCVGGYF
jgi:hypothetical protein